MEKIPFTWNVSWKEGDEEHKFGYLFRFKPYKSFYHSPFPLSCCGLGIREIEVKDEVKHQETREDGVTLTVVQMFLPFCTSPQIFQIYTKDEKFCFMGEYPTIHTYSDGSNLKFWLNPEGQLHNPNGPAFIDCYSTRNEERFFLNGEFLEKEEWLKQREQFLTGA